MNEPPGRAPARRPVGLTMAEYFRDEGGQDVLLFIDNIFRFVQAGSEVSALLGRMPSAVGYQPTLATEMGELQERITSTKQGLDHLGAGHLRAGRRPHRPGAGRTRSPTSTPRRCSRARSRRRASTRPSTRSTRPRASSQPGVVGDEHYDVATRVQQVLQRYKDLQDIIAILGMDELSDEDKVDRAARPQDRALPVAAVPRRRGLHRPPGQVRQARGHDPLVPRDPRGQARRPARAGVLPAGRHRRRARRGRGAPASASA